MFHTPRPRTRLQLLVMCCAVGVACQEDPPDENVRPRPQEPTTGGRSGAGGTRAEDAGPDDDAGSENDAGGGNGGSGAGGTSGASGAGAAGGEGGDGAGVIDAGGDDAFSRRGLLEAAAHCAIAQYEAFRDAATQLVDATTTLAASPDDTSNLTAARQHWRAAMTRWQRAELFRFGPAARSTELGGQNVRDQIYSFPLANDCVVDRQLVSGVYAESGFASSLATGRGLSAIEYLLFHESNDNSCSATSSINTDGSWAALVDELPQRRADYAKAAADDVLARVDALLQTWDANGNNFIEAFVEAGDDTSVFETQMQALDALYHALLYVELDLKDVKLAIPIGISTDCPNAPSPCPDAVESPHAQVSTGNLRQNLIGARRLFEGCGAGHAGLGFDDWLASVDEQDLSERMLTALQGAQAAVDALDVPFDEAVVAEPAKAGAVYDAIKAFTDLLKTEMVTVLMVTLPASAQGDND